MAVTVTFNVGALPTPFCPVTWQQTFQGFVNALTGTVNGLSATGITVSTTAPAAATAPNLWLQVSGSGVPIQLYSYNGTAGDWEPINASFFFPGLTDTGIVNAYKVTVSPFPTAITPGGAPTSGLITGMTFVFKSIHTNTAASTFQVNAYAAAPILSGTTALYPGAIVINDWYMVMWDGTNWQLLNSSNVAPGTVDGQIYTTREVQVGPPAIFQAQWETRVYATEIAGQQGVPAASSSVTFTHGLTVNGAAKTPTTFGAYLICIANDGTYSIGDTIPVQSFFYHLTDGDAFMICWANSALIGVSRQDDIASLNITNKTGASSMTIDTTKWKVIASGSY